MDITTALTAASTAIQGQIGDVLPIVLPVGAGLLGVTVVWKLFKRFVRG